MCGVIGYYSPKHDAFDEVVDGLFQMQHRGQDACGIALSDGQRIRLSKSLGYVREVFHERPSPTFVGRIACGHVRYPTQGSNLVENAQPHLVSPLRGPMMALGSNGDLTNLWEIRAKLAAQGVDFVSTNDGELLVKHIAFNHVQNGMSIVDAIRALQAEVNGAFSACLITPDRLYAFRDPFGIRPLSFGRDGDDWMVASETVALDIARHEFVDEIHPGEIVIFGPEGVQRLPHPDLVAARGGRVLPAQCSFEHIYFSRPDALVFGQYTYDVRKRIGAWLADDDDVMGDVVVPVPDSSNAVALGYAQRSGLPFEIGLIRNHYIGRTFIRPDQPRRDDSVKRKFNPLKGVFEGRSVILVDDSIVRGTTSRKLVRMIRGAGAREIHMRIGSPVTKHSCYYGIDTPDADDLIGHRLSVEEIRTHLTADSLRYLTIDGLRDVLSDRGQHCMACFTGDYPIEPTEAKRADIPLVLAE